MKWIPFITIASLIFSASCKTISPTIPAYNEQSKKYTPKSSQVGIPIEIPLKVIENLVNKKFSGLIYVDDSYTQPTNDDIKIKVTVNKRILLTGQGNSISYQIPLSIWAQGRWSACPICPAIERETSFDIDVFLQSSFELKEDYQFRINTSSKGFQWKKSPTVSIGPIDIPIGRFVEDAIITQLKEITIDIDKNVNASMDLKSQMNGIWGLLQDPFLLDDSTNTWLKIVPTAIKMEPIRIDSQKVKIKMGLESFFETWTGSKPETVAKKNLPNLKFERSSSQNFNISIRSILGYEKASIIAKEALSGQTFSFKRKKITVNDIKIFGKGDKVYFHLFISGSVKGEIYLFGIPIYDPVTNELYFEKLDYDINTKNILIKSADWILGSMVQKKLENKLRFSFDQEVKKIKSELAGTISNYQYKNLYTLKGRLDSFSVQDIYLTDSYFEIILNASGYSNIQIKNIEF